LSARLIARTFIALAVAICANAAWADGTGDSDSLGMYGRNRDNPGVTSPKYLGNAGAEVLTEAELMPALSVALDELSKYHRQVAIPEIFRVPHERIEALVCSAKKCAALAVYRPGEGIYLDEKLKPESSLFDRSILLHELVHYAQEMEGAHDDMKPCLRWYLREQEAYAIQKIFLGMTGSATRVGYSAHGSTCDDEPNPMVSTPAK
jgi:hypothetical protein